MLLRYSGIVFLLLVMFWELVVILEPSICVETKDKGIRNEVRTENKFGTRILYYKYNIMAEDNTKMLSVTPF